MPYRGVIFDCDGVLVDSEPLSCGAWNLVFAREYNIDIGRDYQAILGKSTADAIKHYFSLFDLEMNPEITKKISQLKEEAYIELAQNKLTAQPGIKHLLEELTTLKIPKIVASSGVLSKIQFSLQETGLDSYFSQIVSTEKVKRGKPFPDIFLTAAMEIGVPIQNCIVFEDSINGILAGKASGAFVVALAGTFPKGNLTMADLVIDSFDQVNIQHLLH